MMTIGEPSGPWTFANPLNPIYRISIQKTFLPKPRES
jgi:hypothetical protein